MDHYTIYIEEGKYNTNACNRNEVPTISNNIMCLAALVLLTFIGLIQYSATVIADEWRAWNGNEREQFQYANNYVDNNEDLPHKPDINYLRVDIAHTPNSILQQK